MKTCLKCDEDSCVGRINQSILIEQCLSCGYRLEKSLLSIDFHREGYIDLNYKTSNLFSDDIRWLLSFEKGDLKCEDILLF